MFQRFPLQMLSLSVLALPLVVTSAAGCKTTAPESEVLARETSGVAAAPEGMQLCAGKYDSMASRGSLESEVGKDLSTIMQPQGDSLLLFDITWPHRDVRDVQGFFAPSKRKIEYAEGVTAPKTTNLLQSVCGEKNKFSPDNCKAEKYNSFAIFNSSKRKAELSRLRHNPTASGPVKVTEYLPVVKYDCEPTDSPYGDDAVTSKLMRLREYFTIRNAAGHVQKGYYGRPLGITDGYSVKIAGRGEFKADYNSAVGLLREVIYDTKAQQNLAGLTPRDQFFVSGGSQYYSENKDLRKSSSNKREYGILATAVAVAEMNAAIDEFAANLPGGKREFEMPRGLIPSQEEAKEIWSDLLKEKRVVVGSFGSAPKSEGCKGTLRTLVVMDIHGAKTKLAYPMFLEVCE